jgi:hypothetical protein
MVRSDRVLRPNKQAAVLRGAAATSAAPVRRIDTAPVGIADPRAPHAVRH